MSGNAVAVDIATLDYDEHAREVVAELCRMESRELFDFDLGRRIRIMRKKQSAEYPSPRVVAVGFREASRRLLADPLKVFLRTGRDSHTNGHRHSRARLYAAVALRACFTDCPGYQLALLCNVQGPDGFFSNYDSCQRSGRLPWWDDAVFMAVYTKLGEAFGAGS